MSWRVVLAACLALLLALSVRWFLPTDRPPSPLSAEAPDTRFDYTLSDFSARFRNAQDIVELTVSGPRLEHVSETRIGMLTEPRFNIEPEGADWHGEARRGRILRDDEELVLEDEVILTRPHPNGEIRIQTESLHHHRARRTITSDKPVEIHQAGSWLHAGGMTIRLDDNIIELTNHVQGEIQPATASLADPDSDSSGNGGTDSGPAD